MLHTTEQATERILRGETLLIAGSEDLLGALPRGSWIGGTSAYFMDSGGGVCTESRLFVEAIPDWSLPVSIREYTVEDIASICTDAPDNGFTILILPAGSKVHAEYAANAPGYPGMFMHPVAGWVAGVHLDRLGTQAPKVYGGTACGSAEKAVAMHVPLPAGKCAVIQSVNVFKPGSGEAITFPEGGFRVTECTVGGQTANLATYIRERQIDTRLPLTADYCGSVVNVSIEAAGEAGGAVDLYAPVFPGVEYRFAAPVPDYPAAFEEAVLQAGGEPPLFSWNCILNYLYAGLEGANGGGLTGAVTFGEIACQLLNQTMVSLTVRDSESD